MKDKKEKQSIVGEMEVNYYITCPFCNKQYYQGSIVFDKYIGDNPDEKDGVYEVTCFNCGEEFSV